MDGQTGGGGGGRVVEEGAKEREHKRKDGRRTWGWRGAKGALKVDISP